MLAGAATLATAGDGRAAGMPFKGSLAATRERLGMTGARTARTWLRGLTVLTVASVLGTGGGGEAAGGAGSSSEATVAAGTGTTGSLAGGAVGSLEGGVGIAAGAGAGATSTGAGVTGGGACVLAGLASRMAIHTTRTSKATLPPATSPRQPRRGESSAGPRSALGSTGIRRNSTVMRSVICSVTPPSKTPFDTTFPSGTLASGGPSFPPALVAPSGTLFLSCFSRGNPKSICVS